MCSNSIRIATCGVRPDDYELMHFGCSGSMSPTGHTQWHSFSIAHMLQHTHTTNAHYKITAYYVLQLLKVLLLQRHAPLAIVLWTRKGRMAVDGLQSLRPHRCPTRCNRKSQISTTSGVNMAGNAHLSVGSVHLQYSVGGLLVSWCR